MTDATDHLPMPIPAPLTRAQKSQLLNLVRRAARTEILPRFRKLERAEIDTKSGAMDLVTRADHAAEAMIARGLQMAFPNALVVGEEAAEADDTLRGRIAGAEMCFLVDPVDGTWNFAHGLATFGTMIAVTRFGRPVFGMIYDPLGDDVVMADEDSTTTFTPAIGVRRTYRTASPRSLEEMVGFMHLKLMSQEDQARIAPLYAEIGKPGSLSCSAHEYRLLAQGGADFVLSSKQTPWDHAPGVILCRRAGGHVAMLDGSEYSAALTEGYLLCAANEETWNTVAMRLREALGRDDGGETAAG